MQEKKKKKKKRSQPKEGEKKKEVIGSSGKRKRAKVLVVAWLVVPSSPLAARSSLVVWFPLGRGGLRGWWCAVAWPVVAPMAGEKAYLDRKTQKAEGKKKKKKEERRRKRKKDVEREII